MILYILAILIQDALEDVLSMKIIIVLLAFIKEGC